MQEAISELFPRKKIPHLEHNTFIYGEPFKFNGRCRSLDFDRIEFPSEQSSVKRSNTPMNKRRKNSSSNLDLSNLCPYEVIKILQIVEDHIQECSSLRKKIRNIKLK